MLRTWRSRCHACKDMVANKTTRTASRGTDLNVAGEHIPVLLAETMTDLDLQIGDIVVDCTVNRGGHSVEMASRIGEDGTLICIDLDSDALSTAKARLESLSAHPKLFFVNDSFRDIQSILKGLEIEKVDKLMADLGLSSQELDVSGRGFSFLRNEPLLMTFASAVTEEMLTAKDIVNTWSEEVIADILFYFADERFARRIAKKIVEARKEKEIVTTFDLLEIIRQATPVMYQRAKTHYATRTFQALRTAVNSEIDSIRDLVNALPSVVKEGGRASIITFHSTEDRIVKHTARDIKGDYTLRPLHKKPIAPTETEIRSNIRARSAQLRTYIITKN